MVGVPVLLPLLYSREFVSLQVMVQTLVLAMYWRAVKLPIAYIPLAKGNSRLYLLVEAIYDVVLVLAVIAGFHYYELLGAGIAITLVSALDFFMLFYFMHTTYQYNISNSVWQYLGIQLVFGLVDVYKRQRRSTRRWQVGQKGVGDILERQRTTTTTLDSCWETCS